MNKLESYRKAYERSIERAKRPHDEAEKDSDGNCVVCGLPWPESEDEEPHLCPPGFHWVSPRFDGK